MKRSKPLARRTELRRTRLERGGCQLVRRTKLEPRGRKSAKRRAKVKAKGFGAPRPGDGRTRADAVRELPCIIAGHLDHACTSITRACHARARGRGGAKGTARDLFPGCDLAHRIFGELPGPGHYEGSIRQLAELRYGIDLVLEARKIAERLDTEGYP